MITGRPIARLLALFLLAAPVTAVAAPRGAGAARDASAERRDHDRNAKRSARDEAARRGQPERRAKDADARAPKGERDPAELRAKRERKLRAAGVDGARVERALAVMERYDTERSPIRKELRGHAQALRELVARDSSDDVAYRRELEGLKTKRAKLQDLGERQHAELGEILTPKEQAKLLARGDRDRGGRAARRGGRRAERARGDEG